MSPETPVQRIARENRAAQERRLEGCRAGRHALGPVVPPNLVRGYFSRSCCFCGEYIETPSLGMGRPVSGSVLAFPAGTFGSMNRRQIRRFLGAPRGTTILHNFRDGSSWVVIPDGSVPDLPDSEEDPEEEDLPG